MKFKRSTSYLRYLFVLLVHFNSGFLFAQKEANIWYFGNGAGLDFNYNPVRALTDSKMYTFEGCATISDTNGKLLFYTNGINVWNKNHQTVKNGTELYGHPSSTQCGVIVPYPGNPDLYFIFSIYELGGSLYYSIIDLSGDGGKGEVTVKNKMLLENSTEKITSLKHANGEDFWVIGHEMGNNKFYSWRITRSGISLNPVITSAGSTHPFSEGNPKAAGYMKVSPQGDKIALACYGLNSFVEIFNFNTATGKPSSAKKIMGRPGFEPYGIEFSSDGKLLYISEHTQSSSLFQVKLPFSDGLIHEKGIKLAGFNNALGALQIGPDGKIYVNERDRSYLHIIEYPNREGMNCGLKLQAVDLVGFSTSYGLPNFIQSLFIPPMFSYDGSCINNPTEFTLNSDSSNVDSVKWDFDDARSGSFNASIEYNPIHVFSNVGVYKVKLTVYSQGVASELIKDVTIFPIPTVNLGRDTTLQYGQALIKTAGGNTTKTRWSIGSSDTTLRITAPGTYWATVSNQAGCFSSDTIKVEFEQEINVDLGPDTVVCGQNARDLNVFLPGCSYKWSTGDTTASITVSSSGMYSVEIMNAFHNGTKNDSVTVTFSDNPLASIISRDTVVSRGEALTLKGNGGSYYSWSPAAFLDRADTSSVVARPLRDITYTLIVATESGCTDTAYIDIRVKTDITIPNTFTPNGDGVNDVWVIKNIDLFKNQIQLFNRNGAIVKTFADYRNNWDGRISGVELPVGVYYYHIRIDSKETRTGYLTVLR